MKKGMLLALLYCNIALNAELPNFIDEWIGVYELNTTQNGKPTKQALEIRNHCSNDEIFGGLYCEIGYSKKGANLLILVRISTQKSQMMTITRLESSFFTLRQKLRFKPFLWNIIMTFAMSR